MSATNMLLGSLEETKRLAEQLAATLRPGDTLLLSGDLGAGKTTFTQFLISAMSPSPVEVTSPTFTLVQTYPVRMADGQASELYHYDLYRIENARALAELGLDDAEDFIRVIEWPERAGAALSPASWLHVQLTLENETRRATMRAHGAIASRWEAQAA